MSDRALAASHDIVDLQHAFDSDRLEAVGMFANKASALWQHIAASAEIGDLNALGADFNKVQILADATFLSLQGLTP